MLDAVVISGNVYNRNGIFAIDILMGQVAKRCEGIDCSAFYDTVRFRDTAR